jgi:hypothetical protein
MENPKIKKRGSRQEVFEGRALMTSGNLSREDLIFNERTGKIITNKEKERGDKLKEVMGSKKADSQDLKSCKEELPPVEPELELKRTISEIPPEEKATSKSRRTAAPRKPKAAAKKKTVELLVPELEIQE